MRAILICLSLAAMALAGCAGDDESTTTTGTGTKGTATGTGTTGTTTGTGTTGTTTGSSANRAPTGGISASGLGGPIPLNVTFDLMGTDPDGDPLDWHLDLDGDGQADKSGKALPAQVSHNYTAAGTYNVTFAITDGRLTTTYNVSINATTGGGGPIQVFTASWTGSPYGCAFRGLVDNSLSGLVGWKTEVDPLTVGKPVKAHFKSQAPAAHFTLWYQNAAGGSVTGGTGGTLVPTQSAASDYVWEGLVPDEAAFMTFTSCGGGPTTVDYTAG